MNFQEGTVVITQINHPPITLSGVVIASKKIETEKVFVKDPKTGNVKKDNFEERTFEVFKVMFQNESKNIGTYVWCSESMNYNAPDNPMLFSADLVYAGENHRDCPIEVRKA